MLVVDDDPSILELLRLGLDFEGAEVHGAVDGEQALTRALADVPDLVILDLMLPKLDGLRVLERLQADAPQIPVLVITAHDNPERRARAENAGAKGYLTKPFDFDRLLDEVEAVLR